MFKNVEIETPRLIIRNFKPEDAEAFHSILSQPEVMHYLPENVMTLDEVRGFVDWYQMCYEKNTPEKIIKWTMAVCLKETGEVIGWAGVGPFDIDERYTEIFYGLSAEYWGQGYATEAAQAVLDYAFDVIGLKELVGVANPDNIASVRILEKIGMTFEKKLVGLPEKFKSDEGSHFYSKQLSGE